MSAAREGPQGLRWIALGAAGCLLAATVWLYATSPGSEAQGDAEPVSGAVGDAARPAPPILTVDAHAVRASDARTTVDVAGVLSAVRSVDIAAEVEGRVERVTAEDHAHVAEGQLLIELDRDLHEAAVERSEAALLRAQASDRLAKLELKRQRDLSSRGVSSGAELDRAESEAKTTAAQVAESRASLIEARTRLDKTRITAPFDGIVSAIDVDRGAYLRPGDRIAEVADLSEIEIEVGVGEQEILALRDGDPVEVAVDAVPGKWFDGRIQRTGRLPDARTRKYPVPVRVANPQEQLLPGMLGTVRFELGEARSSIRIPRRAVVREFDLEHVFVLELEASELEASELEASDLEAGRRAARIGAVATVSRRRVVTEAVGFRPDLLEVRSGLTGGERIAISGVRELREGLRVRSRDRRAAELAGSLPAGKPLPEPGPGPAGS